MIAVYFPGHLSPNGAKTLTEHLVVMLEMFGEKCFVFRITKRRMPAKNIGKISINTITIDDALELTKRNTCIMTDVLPRGNQFGYQLLLAQQLKYLPTIINGPGCVSKELLELLNESHSPVICIRKSLAELCEKAGHNYNYGLPQPYVCEYENWSMNKRFNAVSIGRVAWEKRTELIVEANEKLPENKAIRLFGEISDRRYAYHKLDGRFPNWKRYFKGDPHNFGMTTANICRFSKFAVDLTRFSSDGGGTQYSFMEAMDGGATLIVNRDWLKYPGDMVEGENCLAVDNADELVETVLGDPVDLTEGYEKLLHYHSPQYIVDEWLEVIKGVK